MIQVAWARPAKLSWHILALYEQPHCRKGKGRAESEKGRSVSREKGPNASYRPFAEQGARTTSRSVAVRTKSHVRAKHFFVGFTVAINRRAGLRASIQ